MRRIPLPSLAAGARDLDGATGHYLARVLRLARGDRFEAFGGGLVAAGIIEAVDGEHVRIHLEEPSARSASAAPVVWIHGMPKSDKSSSVVQDATELGVSAIVFVETARSVTKIAPNKRDDREARLRKVAESAARQCGRADVPQVMIAATLEDALATAPDDALRIALHPKGAQPLRSVLVPGAATAFFAGPEGGLTDEELAVAESQRFAVAHLGPLVLRTETVPAAVLGALLALG